MCSPFLVLVESLAAAFCTDWTVKILLNETNKKAVKKTRDEMKAWVIILLFKSGQQDSQLRTVS